MRTLVSTVALVAGFALASCLVFAQEPGPKLPAMPSMDQKGSDDLSKPAGAGKPPAPPAAPKPGEGAKTKPPLAKPPLAKPPVTTPQASKPKATKPKATKPVAKAAAAKGPARRPARAGAKPRAGGRPTKGRPARKRK